MHKKEMSIPSLSSKVRNLIVYKVSYREFKKLKYDELENNILIKKNPLGDQDDSI